jgi:hypothetical protein
MENIITNQAPQQVSYQNASSSANMQLGEMRVHILHAVLLLLQFGREITTIT